MSIIALPKSQSRLSCCADVLIATCPLPVFDNLHAIALSHVCPCSKCAKALNTVFTCPQWQACFLQLCRAAFPSETKDGRHGLFGTLQGTEAGPPTLDSWMGHPLVNPNKGKLGLTAPTDPKGAVSINQLSMQAYQHTGLIAALVQR